MIAGLTPLAIRSMRKPWLCVFAFRASATLALLTFFTQTVFAQSPQSIPFPGGTSLEWKVDEMTDQKRCSIFTPMRGMYAGIYGRDLVSFWTPERSLPSPQRQALVRIGAEPPFSIAVGEKPRLLSVPKANGAQIVEAMYRQAKITVRYYTFPELDEQTVTVALGDVGSAYDHAVQLCGWPKMAGVRVPLSKEPNIYKSDKGYSSASFAGDGGWTVTHMPEFGSCEIRAPNVHSIFSSRDGKPEQVLPMGDLVFLKPDGKTVTQLSHESFSPSPIAAILAAAKQAGEYGFIKMGRSSESVSLYGLVEAATYAERACGVILK